MTRTRFPDKDVVLGIALVLAALVAAPATAATHSRSFRPVAHKGATMLFRVNAVKPERITRTELVLAGRRYRVSVGVVRTAVRRKALVRTRLAVAVSARARTRRSRSRARLVVYLKAATTKKTQRKIEVIADVPAETTGTKTSTKPGTKTSTGTTPATGTKTARAPLATAPCGAGWGTFSATNIPGACWRPYGADSPFNQPLPASPRLDPQSTQMVSTITGWGEPENPYAGAADTGSDWNHPVYFSSASDPVFTVHCTRDWGTCDPEGMQVHIPDAARAAGGADGHMAVVDQANNWEYDFWQVQSKPQGGGQLVISWGGRTRIGTDDADGLNSNATAANFALLAGLIRLPELEAGRIDHALFMALKCDGGGHVWPAMGDGSACKDGKVSPKEGQRVFLEMSDAQIAALGLPTWKRAILTALAHYGAFVGDTGASPWSVAIESGSTYTSFGQPDPWVPFVKAQPGVEEWQGKYYLPFKGDVDWPRYLRVADPCVTRNSC